jgi:putative hydrolase of the HAD superfamily
MYTVPGQNTNLNREQATDFMNLAAMYFDAVGTLLHPEPAAATIYAEVGRRHGSRRGAAEIADRFRLAFAHEDALDQAADYRTSEEREQRRWRNIVAEVLDDVRDPEACFRELFEHFARPEAWACDPQTAELLERLAGRGLILGLASNYDERLRPVVAGKPELRLLEWLVISSEVGWRKPAGAFFAALIASADVPAEQILYVGDDVINDYEGGQRAGLHVVLLDPMSRKGSPRTRRIRQLLELEA